LKTPKKMKSKNSLIKLKSANSLLAVIPTNSSSLNLYCFKYLAMMKQVPYTSGYRSQYSDWLRAGRPRGRSSGPGGGKNFHFCMSSRPSLGSMQPPIQWVLGALSLGVKRQGREAHHSPPTSAEVKKLGIYTSTPPHVFMA
jgi:hypothetical protein